MLYSEIKERENRFLLSLKIAIPFVFIIIFVFFIITTDIDIKPLLKNNVIAFLAITFIYVYYILYQIYMAFNTSVIDSTTKAFSKDYILSVIDQKKIKKDKFFIVGIKIKNIEDINDRYGIKKTDNLLNLFINLLNDFLNKNGFKNVYISYIVGGNFLFFVESKDNLLDHILRQFLHKIENLQLEDIYINITYSYMDSSIEDSAQDLMVAIFEQLNFDHLEKRKKRRLNIKVNEFEKLVVKLIDEKRFDFRFQPIKNLISDKIEIYEILIRLKSDKYGKISQNQFISVVNRIGYELTFDLLLIEEIFKILKNLEKNINISINISSHSIINHKFLQHIKKLSKLYNIETNRIILEISENSYISDIRKLNENIKLLRQLGYKIAIENFGKENWALNYIKYLDIDIVKFDIEYTKKYDTKKYIEIVTAFTYLFKKLDTKSVIKFIEDEKSYQFFKEIGVDYIQGYIVGKPKNITEKI